VLASLGLKHITLAPLHRIEDGINAVRMFLPRCWFDAAKLRARPRRAQALPRRV
jgi:hypothetical protein